MWGLKLACPGSPPIGLQGKFEPRRIAALVYNRGLMWRLDHFGYSLPPERIAQSPVSPRDHSRLLRLSRQHGQISHHHFYDLPALLKPNDILVRNNTKVIPARLIGQKASGGQVELLLTKRLETGAEYEIWECLTKPGLKPEQTVGFTNSSLTATCLGLNGFSRLIRFSQSHSQLMTSLLAIGQTPLPPYIAWHAEDELELRQQYQTTFALYEGSAAAPTAGLHFTPELDQQLRDRGVEIWELTLHVGMGTFLRVKTEDISLHEMHSELYDLPAATADRLNAAKRAGQRIVSVGTTTTRVLESCWRPKIGLQAGSGETSLYVYPPRKFAVVDALITNFHEPRSTLLMLVSAFVSQPNSGFAFTGFNESPLGHAYQVALDQEYRFLSFGDAMLIE